jgi:hypothetical protein
MDTWRPSTDPRAAADRSAAGRWRLGPAPSLALALIMTAAAPAPRARANVRAPLVEPRPPSSAALPLERGADAQVLGETLTFRCDAAACDVEARYRIQAPQAVTLQLAFVLPSATPVAVKVGAAAAPVSVAAAPPEALRADEVDPLEQRALERQNLPVLQARFSAPFVAGENVMVVTYRQPLGRQEYGHGYFSAGRWVDFFRYELWPLSEWKHAPGFHVDGEVVIARPPPSWWQRTFSTPRSVGCRGPGPLGGSGLQQRGDELHFLFRLDDPIPRRLWCEVGDEDLVPKT